jgi:hypothetical protein
MLAPRLNAIGRLGDANPVVDLLTSNDEGRIRLIAEQIEAYNARRQLLTSQVMRDSDALARAIERLLDEPLLGLSHPAWPAGVIGIVASRLVDRFGKPVVLVSTPPGEAARASARSVPGVDITAALDSCSDLLVSYGGHAMAAGFSLEQENLSRLRRKLNATVKAAGEYSAAQLQLDGYLQLRELSTALVTDLERRRCPGKATAGSAGQPGDAPVGLLGSRRRRSTCRSVWKTNGEILCLMWWQAADPVRIASPAGPSTCHSVRFGTTGWQGFKLNGWIRVSPPQSSPDSGPP